MICFTVCSAPVLGAWADDRAQDLANIGLLKGDGESFALSAEVTREEAAVMIVRLLGKEKEALAQNTPSPFADVSAWASPYIGYLYCSGLTQGNGDGLYGASVPCTKQMYDTFMLRVLGYRDNMDFTFDGATVFAASLGLSSYPQSESFRRKDMVATTFLALLAQPKTGSPLIAAYESAQNEGAVSVLARRRLFEEMAGKETNFSSFYEQGFAAKATWTYTLHLNNETFIWEKVTDFATQPTENGLRCQILLSENAQFFGVTQENHSVLWLDNNFGWAGKQIYPLSDVQYEEELKSVFSWADTAFSLDLAKTIPFVLVSGVTKEADSFLMNAEGIVSDLGGQQWSDIFSLDPSQWTYAVGKVAERVIQDKNGQVSLLRVFFPVTLSAGTESYLLTVERQIEVLGRGSQVQLTLPDVFTSVQ